MLLAGGEGGRGSGAVGSEGLWAGLTVGAQDMQRPVPEVSDFRESLLMRSRLKAATSSGGDKK